MMILSLINKNPVSRAEIAKETGLTKAAVTIIVDELIKREMIVEKKSATASVGRNPLNLYLNGKSLYFIGIDVSRVDISVGIVDLCGKVICETCFPVCDSKTAFEKIKIIIDKMLLENKIDKDKIYKAGISVPGPVDIEKGKILNPPNFKLWHNAEVRELARIILNTEAVFDNVSKAAAVSEKYFGAAKESENFLSLIIDEGIGTGIFTDNILLKKPCEMGHITIEYDGIPCECGNKGCLEKYASIPVFLKKYNLKKWEDASDSQIEIMAEYIVNAVITANNIFLIDKVVLKGDVAKNADKLIELISEKCNVNLLNNKIEISAGTVNSKTLIAASLAIHNYFEY